MMPLHNTNIQTARHLLNTLIVPKPKLGFQLTSLNIIINDTNENVYIE